MTPFIAAWQEFGVHEIPGPISHERIIMYHASVGLSGGDTVPWCSSFRNWCEEAVNGAGSGTNRPDARSWEKWGNKIEPFDAIPGDTCVFYRGTPVDWPGHVGFFIAWSQDLKWILVLGGNQNDRVCLKWYSATKLSAIRRAN